MDEDEVRHTHELVIGLDDFTWDALSEEALRLGVSDEELARFALIYYLADLDSGRMTRRVPAAAVLAMG